MKSKYLRFAAAGFAACMLLFQTACDDIIDLQPEQEIPEDIGLNTIDKFEALVAATYEPLTRDAMYGRWFMRAPELMADNLELTLGGIPNDPFVTYSTSQFDQGNRDMWGDSYYAIRNANTILNALDENIEIAGATEANRTQWRGEALFVRAIAHFELVRLWGKPYGPTSATDPGVVIRTRLISGNEALDRTPRSSVAAVYDQVIADLQQAANLLPNIGEANPSRGRATRQAAQALLARVYFNQNNLQAAFDLADAVIANFAGRGDGLGTPLQAFRNSGVGVPQGGVIFQAVTGNVRAWSGDTRAPGDLPISTELESLYGSLSVSDLRRTTLIEDAPNGFTYSLKYSPNTPLNRPVLRLAEMHLIRAEAGAVLGGAATAAAQASFNAIRQAADPTYPNTALTGDALVNAVQFQRRVELALEGDRYHQLRRTQQNVRSQAYDSQELLLTIPDNEIGANPDIQQN